VAPRGALAAPRLTPPLAFRSATARDARAVADLIHGSPGREAVALLGGEARARRFGIALTLLEGRREGWERTLLAEREGVPVGVCQWRRGSDPGFDVTLALALAALRSLGPLGALRARQREAARRRVNAPPPADAFHIQELHVLPSLRGAGIGARLLARAEELARAGGFPRLSLITHAANPAQRLYLRCGFEIAERREDAEYQRLTGIPGRVLMVKTLPVIASGGMEGAR
jgi:ribosomal protein S18 acetylase RimI-like enzyme